MRNRALGGMRVNVKSPSVGRRKRAATRQDQTDTIKSRLKAAAGGRKRAHSVLVVDVGGTSVKIPAISIELVFKPSKIGATTPKFISC